MIYNCFKYQNYCRVLEFHTIPYVSYGHFGSSPLFKHRPGLHPIADGAGNGQAGTENVEPQVEPQRHLILRQGIIFTALFTLKARKLWRWVNIPIHSLLSLEAWGSMDE